MDPTFLFLIDRKRPGRDHRASRDWAIRLLQDGYESDAILRLAGITEETWHFEPELVTQILHDIGQAHLLVEESFHAAYERAIVADYYAGIMDASALIQKGVELYHQSGSQPEYFFWVCLSEDYGQHGDQGICCEYRFDLFPADQVLKQALADRGFPAPTNREDTNSH